MKTRLLIGATSVQSKHKEPRVLRLLAREASTLNFMAGHVAEYRAGSEAPEELHLHLTCSSFPTKQCFNVRVPLKDQGDAVFMLKWQNIHNSPKPFKIGKTDTKIPSPPAFVFHHPRGQQWPRLTAPICPWRWHRGRLQETASRLSGLCADT